MGVKQSDLVKTHDADVRASQQQFQRVLYARGVDAAVAVFRQQIHQIAALHNELDETLFVSLVAQQHRTQALDVDLQVLVYLVENVLAYVRVVDDGRDCRSEQNDCAHQQCQLASDRAKELDADVGFFRRFGQRRLVFNLPS